MLPALINTVWMTVLALAVAVPLGIGGAIYLVEYANRGNSRLVRLVRLTAETLSGIPSIVYGLFGMMSVRDRLCAGAIRCWPAR